MRFSSECFEAHAVNKLSFVASNATKFTAHVHLDTAADPWKNMEKAETGSSVAAGGCLCLADALELLRSEGFCCYYRGKREQYD